MKPTARGLAYPVAVVIGLATASVCAGALPNAIYFMGGASVLGQATTDGTQGPPTRRDVDRWLAEARRAIAQGDLQRAETLVTRAEQSKVRYTLFHLGNTPPKLRRALAKASARSGGAMLPSQRFDPATSTSDASPAVEGRRSDRLGRLESPPAFREGPGNHPDPAAHIRLPNRLEHGGLAHSPFGRDVIEGPEAIAYEDPFAPAPVLQTSQTKSDRGRTGADGHLLSARQALSLGNLPLATDHLQRAKRMPTHYGPHDDSPDKLEADLIKFQGVLAQFDQGDDSPELRRRHAEALLEQSAALLQWKDFDSAERLATAVDQLGMRFGAGEVGPQELIKRIAHERNASGTAPKPAPVMAELGDVHEGDDPQVRKQQALTLLHQARDALASGALNRAERLAQKANGLNVPDSMFRSGEDRPWLVALKVRNARSQMSKGQAQPSAVVTADGSNMVGPDRVQPSTHESPVNANPRGHAALVGATQPADSPPTRIDSDPAPAKLNAPRLAQSKNTKDAPKIASPEPNELPVPLETSIPPSQGASGGAPGKRPHIEMQPVPTTTHPPSLLDKTADDQKVLARKIAADVINRLAQAQGLREVDPKRCLELLFETREMINRSGVDSEARARLLRRVERDIGETEQYIEDNRAQIELDEQNRSVLDHIDRQRRIRIEVDQKLAELVDDFNELRDQQRFAEMEVIAMRARELAPEKPIAQQLWQEARFIRRHARNRDIAERKEDFFVRGLVDVDESVANFDPTIPFQFGPIDDWKKLKKLRRRHGPEDGFRRNERELEIERQLKSPVMLNFTAAPLSEVIAHLSRLSGINIHLDLRGMADEGVSSDTLVTINLTDEISLRSVLNIILENHSLGFVIKDEVLKITSEQLQQGETYTRTYHVADLVIPIPNFTPGSSMGLQGAINDATSAALGYGPHGGGFGPPLATLASHNGANGSAMINPQLLARFPGATGTTASPGMPSGGPGGGAQADFDSLIELITTTVEPDSWDEVGGPGSLSEFATNLSLVVSQTQDVHEQIADLLDQLRRLQDLQVTIEVRFITLSDDFFERIGIDFDFNIEDGSQYTQAQLNTSDRISPSVTVGASEQAVGDIANFTADLDIPYRSDSFNLASPIFGSPVDVATFGFAILSDIEAFFIVNAAHGDRRSNVLQAPKVTLFNGQQAVVSDTSASPFVISVIPVVGDFAAAQQPVIVVLSEGTTLSVQAVVSNDRRFVRLTVVPFFSQIGDVDEFTFEGSSTTTTSTSSAVDDDDDSVLSSSNDNSQFRQGTTVQLPTFAFVTVTTTVSVPDGGTVLLGGIKRLAEGRNEFGVPLLSKIPYINRLFKNVGIGRETESLMMMVTPRIIIQEEEEERLLGGSSE